MPNPSFISCLLSVCISTPVCEMSLDSLHVLAAEREKCQACETADVSHWLCICGLYQPVYMSSAWHPPGMLQQVLEQVGVFTVGLHVIFNLFWIPLMCCCRFLVYICTSNDWLSYFTVRIQGQHQGWSWIMTYCRFRPFQISQNYSDVRINNACVAFALMPSVCMYLLLSIAMWPPE